MCLILLSYREWPDRPLVVAANRDEFYARPALPAWYWKDAPQVFAGRDLEAGGTWLGISTGGRFAALTNYTDFQRPVAHSASRGDLTRAFLEGRESAFEYAAAIDGSRFQGFNLVVWDGDELVYACNRTGEVRVLEPGAYALANSHLDDDWPKAARGVGALEALPADATSEDVLDILLDESEGYLADGHEAESARRSTPAFLRGREYGTRACTAVIFEGDGVEFVEQLYGPMGVPGGRVAKRRRIDSEKQRRAAVAGR